MRVEDRLVELEALDARLAAIEDEIAETRAGILIELLALRARVA
jgi:hypothetical protein